MRAELKSVLSEAGTTTIYVTHDQTEAMEFADRISVMHQGRIVLEAPPTQIYRRRCSMLVGGFVGSPPGTAVRGGETIRLRPNLAYVDWVHPETSVASEP